MKKHYARRENYEAKLDPLTREREKKLGNHVHPWSKFRSRKGGGRGRKRENNGSSSDLIKILFLKSSTITKLEAVLTFQEQKYYSVCSSLQVTYKQSIIKY